MNNKPRILIVEDEPALASIFQDYLLAEGFDVDVHHTGEHVVEDVRNNTPDLILLDRMLPVKDGLTICSEIREFSVVPIIMVTAKVEEADRLKGLDGGADDYICKPAKPKEIVARVKAVLRRSQLTETLAKGKTTVMTDVKGLNESGVRSLDLTEEESRLLEVMSASTGQAVNAAELQVAFTGTNSLDQIVEKMDTLSHKLSIVWQVEEPIHNNGDGTFSLKL